MEDTKYEIDKQKRKQDLVRNEFLYNGKSAGKYDFPIIRKQDIDVEKIKLMSFSDAKPDDSKNRDKTLHFFTYDWKFENVYEKAADELEKLKQYYCLLSPDFSIFTNMPLALQIESVFKNRWCGAFWQSRGLNVIPTVSWGDEKSFDFCFDGIEEGAVVFVCAYYRENDDSSFMTGYNEMIKRIKPSLVLCYDEPFGAMKGKGNVKSFLPTTYEWVKNLPLREQARFDFEKRNRNVVGLNPRDFKYIDYKDPYALDFLAKCPVCGKICAVDQFGNGECDNCSWGLGRDDEKVPDKVQYPNLVSLGKARRLYREGKALKPDFDDFIAGLEMYSEMTFYYKGIEAAVYYDEYGNICLEYGGQKAVFPSAEGFYDNARVDGKLLKDVWNKVEKADYMQG